MRPTYHWEILHWQDLSLCIQTDGLAQNYSNSWPGGGLLSKIHVKFHVS